MNYDKRIHLRLKLCNTVHSNAKLSSSFKGKRRSNDTYRKNTHIADAAGNNRSRTGSDTASHTCCNKHKVSVAKRDLKTSFIAHRTLFADFGRAACSASLCQAFSNLKRRHACQLQCAKLLCIRVDCQKLNSRKLVLRQSEQYTVSASADTDYLNPNDCVADISIKIHRVRLLPKGIIPSHFFNYI